MSRPRKSPAEVRAARQKAAKARWSKLGPRQRRKAVEPAANARRKEPPAGGGRVMLCPHGQAIGVQGGVTAMDIASHADFGDGSGILEFYSACDCCDTLMHHSHCGSTYVVMKDGRTLCSDCVKGEEDQIDS